MKSGAWLVALACMAAPQLAWARQEIRLERQMFVERVSTDINGRARRVLESAGRAESGDQLIFVVNWRNAGNRPIRNLAVTNAVPRGAQPDLTDPAMQVSVDGGARWGRLSDLWLPTALGGTRRAVPADITHIRWTVPDEISPGESGRLSYRATVR
ncbi:hypothetical protein Sj15T_04610 [Sphingobium sp. TA15]|uniref:DUF11 domain-containing protein n=1 Tax=Sphingobium indicum (strain DSM 16413 / CCM 7287 / MTCC 6362 / UT26 / NBRC 101211 / UT26S) TaxID=452662 RepID=D4Z0K4_SPHIU|nr:hypothetical protein [Sphingobium indicum]BAI96136.1 hypothetical protein SJA_C1-13020 [Sphingobium indicum UT26S]BDD65440.1 hypothetical protein Sj15T_04610 [Sphingobium sp. TA15]